MNFYIDPVLISLGQINIHYYGLVYAIGFFIFYLLLQKKRHEITFSEDECSELLLTSGISMIVFGRLFHFIFDNPQVLLQNPLEFFMIWHGGIAFFGSFFGLVLGALAYLKIKKKPVLKSFLFVSDLMALVAAGALIFGRLANFINQELVGTATSVPWCFNFLIGFNELANPLFDTVCRHPYQLYAAFSHVILFALLFAIYKKNTKKETKHKPITGLIFTWFIILYAIMRFITDFWREDTRIFIGLTVWQFISIVALGIGIWMHKKIHNKK